MSNKSCIEQIRNYLIARKSNLRHSTNSWFEDKNMKVYMRFGAGHYIQGLGVAKTIDIASIEINEDVRGHGIFTKFLDDIVNMINPGIIYIENVLEIRLVNFLEKTGWTIIGDQNDIFPPCFYKVTGEKK